MTETVSGPEVDLNELRAQLTEQVALSVMICSPAIAAAFLPVHSIPESGFVGLLLLFGLGWSVRLLSPRRPTPARGLKRIVQ